MRRAGLRRLPWLAGGLGVCSVFAVVGTTPSTSSFLYDVESMTISASAGTWDAGPPAECQEVMDRPHATLVKGDDGADTLGGNEPPDGNHPQVILGMGGKDTLRGGNQSDCLVGGTGDDQLIAASDDPTGHAENGKDILLGGPGDDYLKSGNGKDYLDGGPGTDTCEGDRGKDAILNCEVVIEPEALRSSTVQQPDLAQPEDEKVAPTPAQQAPDEPEDGTSDPEDSGAGGAVVPPSTDASAGDPGAAPLEADPDASAALPTP